MTFIKKATVGCFGKTVFEKVVVKLKLQGVRGRSHDKSWGESFPGRGYSEDKAFKVEDLFGMFREKVEAREAGVH